MTDDADEADVELYKQLRAVEFATSEWRVAETEFFHYGWSVLLAWLTSGLIAQRCTEKGRPIQLPAYWSREDREDVTSLAVGDGLAMFRRAVTEDLWHPSLGASLKNYFLGGCVLAFPNALRWWERQRRHHHDAVTALAKLAEERRQEISPVTVVDSTAAVDSLVRDENARNQTLMRLVADGYEPAEIAEILQLTPGAVHARMTRLRRKFAAGESERRAE